MTLQKKAHLSPPLPEETEGGAQTPRQALPDENNAAAATVTAHLAQIQSDIAAEAFGNGAIGQTGNAARTRTLFAPGPNWFMAVDLFGLLAGFLLAWGGAAVLNHIVHGRPYSDWSWIFVEPRLIQFTTVGACVILWFENTGHYRLRMPFWIEAHRIFAAMTMALMVDVFLLFAMKQDASRFGLIFGWIFGGLAIEGGRCLLRTALRRKGLWQIRTLLVGSGPLAEETRAVLDEEPALGYDVATQIEDLSVAMPCSGNSWQGLCKRHRAAHVMIALEGAALEKAYDQIAQLMRDDIPFSVAPALGQMPVLGMEPLYFFNHDLMLLMRSSGLEQPLPRIIKRSMDIVVSALALVFLSPFFLVLALLTKLDGGPAFFCHTRIGMNGRRFGCLKFRSMRVDADAVLAKILAEDPVARAEYETFHKLKDDPRVTRIGHFLRRTSLDELPQIINVLIGDMSLVGPRPIVLEELTVRGPDAAYYNRVRPGLTGLWQVSGRSDVSFARRIQMEGWYVRNWSLWNDIAILFKTIPILWNSRGAY